MEPSLHQQVDGFPDDTTDDYRGPLRICRIHGVFSTLLLNAQKLLDFIFAQDSKR